MRTGRPCVPPSRTARSSPHSIMRVTVAGLTRSCSATSSFVSNPIKCSHRCPHPTRSAPKRESRLHGASFRMHTSAEVRGCAPPNGQAGLRKLEVAVADRGPHALACLLDCCRGETDQRKGAGAAAADIGLDVDGTRVQAEEHARVGGSEHDSKLLRRRAKFSPGC